MNEKPVEINLSVNEKVGTLDELGQLYAKVSEQFTSETTLTSLIKNQLKDAFQKHPNVKTIEWHQYTPYFNDGDPCYFRGPGEIAFLVDDPSLYEGHSYDEDRLEDYITLSTYGDDCPQHIKDLQDDFDWICRVNSDFMERMFGDHVRVFVDRDLTIRTSEFHHD